MTENKEDNKPTEAKPDSVGHGLLMLILMHGLQIPMAFYSAWILIGLSQLIYVIPYAIKLSREERKQSLKGLLIGTGITFLLNSACFGYILFAFSH